MTSDLRPSRPEKSSPASVSAPMRVALLNASLRADGGNSHLLTSPLAQICRVKGATVDLIELASYRGTTSALGDRLTAAQALVLVSGCYWSSPGSVMQRFLEVATRWECKAPFLGKPAAVVVSMHSVGGLEAARSVGMTLQLLGCLLPPLGMVVLGQTAMYASSDQSAADTWTVADLDPMLDNVLLAAKGGKEAWASWPVERVEVADGPYPSPGRIDLDAPAWFKQGSPYLQHR